MVVASGTGVASQSSTKYPTWLAYVTFVASSLLYLHRFTLNASPVTGAVTGCALAYAASCCRNQK